MSAALPLATRPPRAGLVAAIESRPLTFALVLILFFGALRLTGTVDSDVAWQLWIAGRLRAGANLYTDIIETNPPLWFWMAVPLERIAEAFDLPIETIAISATSLWAALALAATSRLTDHIEPFRRSLLLGYGVFALLGIPWVHEGQREQILLIGTIPYAALVASRQQQKRVPTALAATVGVAAALAFALKHYFLIVPAALELWLLAGQRRRWRPLRPENLAILLVGFLYGLAILLFEPDYLTRIVPLVRLAYGGLGAPSLRYMFGTFAIVGIAIFAIVAFFVSTVPRKDAPFANALTVAALACGMAYFVQFKGWPYHALPLVSCSSLALAALLAEQGLGPPALRLLAPALLVLPLVPLQGESHSSRPGQDILDSVAGLRPGQSVAFLTTETAIPWSVTLQGRYRYASRYNGFWMISAIIRNEHSARPDPALTELGRQIIRDTVDDFTCIPPQRIVVKRPRGRENVFDVLPVFLRDPGFAALLSHYRVRSRTTLETYQLVSPLGPPPISGCRHGV